MRVYVHAIPAPRAIGPRAGDPRSASPARPTGDPGPWPLPLSPVATPSSFKLRCSWPVSTTLALRAPESLPPMYCVLPGVALDFPGLILLTGYRYHGIHAVYSSQSSTPRFHPSRIHLSSPISRRSTGPPSPPFLLAQPEPLPFDMPPMLSRCVMYTVEHTVCARTRTSLGHPRAVLQKPRARAHAVQSSARLPNVNANLWARSRPSSARGPKANGRPPRTTFAEIRMRMSIAA